MFSLNPLNMQIIKGNTFVFWHINYGDPAAVVVCIWNNKEKQCCTHAVGINTKIKEKCPFITKQLLHFQNMSEIVCMCPEMWVLIVPPI